MCFTIPSLFSLVSRVSLPFFRQTATWFGSMNVASINTASFDFTYLDSFGKVIVDIGLSTALCRAPPWSSWTWGNPVVWRLAAESTRDSAMMVADSLVTSGKTLIRRSCRSFTMIIDVVVIIAAVAVAVAVVAAVVVAAAVAVAVAFAFAVSLG